MESESGQSDVSTVDTTKRIIKYFSKCLIELINHAESIQYKSRKLVNYDVSSTITYDSGNEIDITEHNIKTEIRREGPIFIQIDRIKKYIVELLTICSQQNILIDYDTTKPHIATYDDFEDSQRILIMNHLTLHVISIVENIYLSIRFFKSKHLDNGQQIKKTFANVYKEIKSLPMRSDIIENMDSSFKSLTHKSEYKDSYNYLVEKLNTLSKYICKFNKSFLKKCGYNDFLSTECSTDDDNSPRKKNIILERTYINHDVNAPKEPDSVFKVPETTEYIHTTKHSNENIKKVKETESNDNCETTNKADSLFNELLNDTLKNLNSDTDKRKKKKNKAKTNSEQKIIDHPCNSIEDNTNQNQNTDNIRNSLYESENEKNKETMGNSTHKNIAAENKGKEKDEIPKKRKANNKDQVKNKQKIINPKIENHLTSTETDTILNDTEKIINKEAANINEEHENEENKSKNDNENLEKSTQNNDALEKNIVNKNKEKEKIENPKKRKGTKKNKVENKQTKKRKLGNHLTSTETNSILNDTKGKDTNIKGNISHEEYYDLDEDELSFLSTHFLTTTEYDVTNDSYAIKEAENDDDDDDVATTIRNRNIEIDYDEKEFADFTRIVKDNQLNEHERFLYIQDLIEKANDKMAVSEEAKEKVKNLHILVDWEVCPAHLICSNVSSGPTDEERQLFKKLGVTTGIYSAKEDKMIQTNWKTFCEKHDLDENPTLFVNSSHDNKKLLPYSERRKFLQYIGQGLSHRSLHSISRRFKVLFKPKVKYGRFTAEEDDLIITYLNKIKREDCKQKFARLAPLINRDRMQIQRRYQILKQASEKSAQKVVWTLELKEKFLKHLLEETKSESIENLRNKHIDSGIYLLIGKLMNIAPKKLRVLWTFRMHTELFASEPIYIELIRIKIIKKIRELGYDDWKVIDWNRIRDMFDDAYTKSYVWFALKNLIHDHVPPEIHTDLTACIDYLYEDYLPNMEGKLKPRILPRLAFVDGTLSHYY